MEKKKKVIISIIIVLTIILVVGAITYALFTWRSPSNININSGVNAPVVTFDGKDSSITGVLEPVRTMEEGTSKTITVVANAPGSTIDFYLNINTIPDDLKDESFRYVFIKNDEVISEGDFSSDNIDYEIDDITTIELITGEEVNTTLDTYILYLWIDGNMSNSYSMGDKEIDFDIYAESDSSTLNEIS